MLLRRCCDFVIVAFQLTERKFLEIPLPFDLAHLEDGFSDGGLWVFKGFLSVWVFGSQKVDIWVMEEYKVLSSWTKTLVLSIDSTPCFIPLCCTKSGDIVGTDSWTRLIKCNNEG